MGKSKAVAPACRFSETHLVNGYNKFFYKLKLVISIVLALLCVVVKDVLSLLPPFAGYGGSLGACSALGCTACNDGSFCCQIVHCPSATLRVWDPDQDLEVLLESNSKTTFNYVKHCGSVAHIHTHTYCKSSRRVHTFAHMCIIFKELAVPEGDLTHISVLQI